jgi:hypothetical protein
MRFALLEMRWKLRAESSFVQADNGRLAGCIVDRDDIETKGAILDCAARRRTSRFSLPMLSSGCAGWSLSTWRMRTSTTARVSPSKPMGSSSPFARKGM